jgi:hypothetical protein
VALIQYQLCYQKILDCSSTEHRMVEQYKQAGISSWYLYHVNDMPGPSVHIGSEISYFMHHRALILVDIT